MKKPSKVIVGSVLMDSSCSNMDSNEERVRYNAYSDEMEYIGDVIVSHNIFDTLNDRGYSLRSYGRLAEGALEEHDYEEITNTLGVTIAETPFRLGPGDEYESIETLGKDVSVEILARSDNGWFLVQHHKKLGFISGEVLQEVPKEKKSSMEKGYSVDRWMPFGGTIGIHDASWERSYKRERGSHGLISYNLGSMNHADTQPKVYAKQ